VRAAVRLAVKRHAGTVETVFTVSGPALVQRGKDLSEVGVVIGTGGALVHSPDPVAILATALRDPDRAAALGIELPPMAVLGAELRERGISVPVGALDAGAVMEAVWV